MHLLSLITANISKSLKKEKFVRVWQGMTQMQNEQGGKKFINKNGYTEGRGRQTVHTTGQGIQPENRMVGEKGQTLRHTGTR